MTAGCVAEELQSVHWKVQFRLDTASFVPLAVSPGFTPRPSLSERQQVESHGDGEVSPGFTPRPSLSVLG